MENIKLTTDFKLSLETLSGNDLVEKYLDIFKLRGRYIFHKEQALRLVNLKLRYSKSEIDSISNTLNVDSIQLTKDIFGEDLYDDEYNHAPFVKFRRDIAEQLGIID